VTASTLVEPAYYSAPPYAKTLGPEVADICELAGFTPDPEQRLALDAIFGMRPNNKVAALEAAIVAPRQNIKTGLFKQCALGWLFVTDQRLIIWSAHEFSTAQEAFRDLTELIEGSDPLRKRIKAIHRGNGDEAIELLTGQRVKFKARTKTGGRGLSGDKIVLDEAFALLPNHMGSLFPLLSARPDPQVVYGSSAGLETSSVLRSVRDRGRLGTDPQLVYVEFCDDLPGECELPSCDHKPLTAVGCRMDDVRRWHRANSQLGRRITVDYVAAERRSLPPEEFGRERMGWWDAADGAASAAIDFNRWLALIDTNPVLTAPTFAIATAPDRSWSSICAAWRRPDGSTQILIGDDYRPDAIWVPARIAELRSRWGGRVIAANKAAQGLVADAENLSEADQAKAHNALSDGVLAGTVRHGNEPAMNTAVRAARWKAVGNTRVLDQKGSTDTSPLLAAAGAVHGVTTAPTSSGWMVGLP
jgi:hypothetical protein